MLTLLEQNREEVRFWQNLLFTTSFWFTAGIFGIVSFNVGKRGYHRSTRLVSVGGCLLLCMSFFVFVNSAEGALVVNHDDLIGIQYGLNLSEEGAYLLEGQVIYQEGDFGSEPQIKPLVQFYVLVVILAVAVLLFLPGLPEKGASDGGPN